MRQRQLILAVLVVLTVACWAILLWQQAQMGADLNHPPSGEMSGRAEMAGMGEPALPGQLNLTLGMDAPLFLSMWVVMMGAMMFPTAAPMILTFSRIAAGKRQRGQAFVPTWVFVGSYLALWTLFGGVGYAAALGVDLLASPGSWLGANAGRLGGALLVGAGLYQLSPWKQVCLTHCRAPVSFVLQAWRDGYGGAVRMGVEHGLYCLGCCWLLFVILFPLGVMNVAAMALLTLLIFAEKVLPWSRRATQVSAGLLVAYGVLALFVPGALPGLQLLG